MNILQRGSGILSSLGGFLTYPILKPSVIAERSKVITKEPHRAPANSRADAPPSVCGTPNASQPTTPRGTAGQVKVTVSQGSKELWCSIATRPSTSSGTNGLGIELQYVSYRGKSVLRRASAPILNVQF